MAMLVLMCLCAVTIMQLTSSQSTYYGNSCGHMEGALSQLQTTVSQMQTATFQLVTAVSQMQREIAELKAFNQQTVVTGILGCRLRSIISLSRYSVEINV